MRYRRYRETPRQATVRAIPGSTAAQTLARKLNPTIRGINKLDATRTLNPIFAILIIFLATACGGGGGGGGGTNTTPPPAPANQAPAARFSLSPMNGTAPLTIVVDAASSFDNDGNIVSYTWDFGGTQAIGVTASHTFTQPGTFTVTLQVTDDDGATDSTSTSIEATPAATNQRIEGTVNILSSTAVDADVNDRLTVASSNNDFDAAQTLISPVIVGGFANIAGTGETTGNLFASGDAGDFYRLSLTGGEVITLNIAETNADLDLRLWDDTRTLVDASVGTSPQESLSVPQAGTYFVEVFPFAGASNYVLVIGQDVSTNAYRPPNRLSDPFVPGEVLLGQNQRNTPVNGARMLEQIHAEPGGVFPSRLLLTAEQKLVIPAGANVSRQQIDKLNTLVFLKSASDLHNVRWSEPNIVYLPDAQPDDTFFANQWHYSNINLPLAWDTTTGSTDVIAAVIDTGVLLNHPDLTNNLVPGYDFVSDAGRARDGDGIDDNPDDPGDRDLGGSSSFHGTHVAGTVAAQTDNARGVAGAGWDTRIMPVRALGVDGGTTFDIAQAMRFAAGLSNNSGTTPATPADVINLSLGSSFSSQTTQDTINEILQAGVIVIASAGNESSSLPRYPAAYDGVIGVSATTISNTRASYSNFGTYVDIAAPGGSSVTDLNGDGIGDGVISTSGDDSGTSITFGYSAQSGTSMAAPHVTGVVALMKAIHPAMTPDEFMLALQAGDLTDDLGPQGRDDEYGYGLINAQKAVLAAELLANGQGSDPGPILSASSSTLNFGAFVDGLSVTLRNIGTGSIAVGTVSADQPWVTVTPPSGSALGEYTINIDRSGLADGAYQSTVTFPSDANDVALRVIMQVSSIGFQADTGLIYVILVDEDGGTSLPAVLVQSNQGEYPFVIDDVPAGQYRLFAGTDADDDAFLCDAGESCGAYPTLDEPEFLNINSNLTGLNFESGFRLNLTPSNLTSNAQGEATSDLKFEKIQLLPQAGD